MQKSQCDGLNRGIVKERYAGAALAETRQFYYNDQWQVLEEHVGADPATTRVDAANVCHPNYVDSLALRHWDSNASGGTDAFHYYLQERPN